MLTLKQAVTAKLAAAQALEQATRQGNDWARLFAASEGLPMGASVPGRRTLSGADCQFIVERAVLICGEVDASGVAAATVYVTGHETRRDGKPGRTEAGVMIRVTSGEHSQEFYNVDGGETCAQA